MSDGYALDIPDATTHSLQVGSAGDVMDGTFLAGRSETRASMWGYCAFCKWSVGGMDTTRAVRRAYDRHLKTTNRKVAPE